MAAAERPEDILRYRKAALLTTEEALMRDRRRREYNRAVGFKLHREALAWLRSAAIALKHQ